MTDTALTPPRWTIRLSNWARTLGILTVVVVLVGVLLARFDIIGKIPGLMAMVAGAGLALFGALFGLLGVVMNLRNKAGVMAAALTGLVLSGGYLGYMASRVTSNTDKAGLHDVSTDLANPPAFRKLSLRADNLVGVDTVENWRSRHAAAYPNIKTLTLTKPVATVIADAERLAKARGWEVALADPANGQLEATDCVSLICYRDDVIIRASASPDGKATMVDMRSVSRVGQGDLGVNARRVTAFLADLQK